MALKYGATLLVKCNLLPMLLLAAGVRSLRARVPKRAKGSRAGFVCGLTFELSGRQRLDARPGLAKMYRVPPDRAWWPAVGAPLEQVVRPCTVLGWLATAGRERICPDPAGGNPTRRECCTGRMRSRAL